MIGAAQIEKKQKNHSEESLRQSILFHFSFIWPIKPTWATMSPKNIATTNSMWRDLNWTVFDVLSQRSYTNKRWYATQPKRLIFKLSSISNGDAIGSRVCKFSCFIIFRFAWPMAGVHISIEVIEQHRVSVHCSRSKLYLCDVWRVNARDAPSMPVIR